MRKKRMLILLIICIPILFFWGITTKWLIDGAKPKANGTYKYVIVLGAKVKKGAIPSKALAFRLDAALTYAKQYPYVYIVVSGGQGFDEDATEASVMKQYLIDRGFPVSQIIVEDKSTSTYENLLNTKKIIGEDLKGLTIVSSDYHLARAKMLAEELQIKCDVVPAKTPKSIEAKVRFRERFALLKSVITGK
ncbi:YdcF family protein [Rummeliibacillus pycnus]|uniref:YdcF family protein n=1 Tax=Rummeliibacillus pycnus TaxID=101070 RepID=UPI003D2DCD92